jgi:tetratricopeptide (TPR) repeat protein
MKPNRKVPTVAACLLVVLFAGSVLAHRSVEASRGSEATLEEVLYISSGRALKNMSLGYSSLLADIYWTRAVQYFGSRVRQSTRFDLLAPLLDITTELDPHLIPAYQTGSIFLTQKIPYGAGEPDKAVGLLHKGIRENSAYWRLYFTLGFVHYLDRRDYRAAEQAFEAGSEIPGALPWMKILAARMAEHAEDIGTAAALWKAVYETNKDKTVQETALKHLASLQADADIQELEKRVRIYRERTGSFPKTWSDLVRAGILPRVPLDPTGAPYELLPNGTVWVADSKQLPFVGESRERTAQ